MISEDYIIFNHAYEFAGNYTVDVVSINNVSVDSTAVDMTCQNPVKGVHFYTNTPVTRGWVRGGLAIFTIFYVPDEALFATGLCDSYSFILIQSFLQPRQAAILFYFIDAHLTITFGLPNGSYEYHFFTVDETYYNITLDSTESLDDQWGW